MKKTKRTIITGVPKEYIEHVKLMNKADKMITEAVMMLLFKSQSHDK